MPKNCYRIEAADASGIKEDGFQPISWNRSEGENVEVEVPHIKNKQIDENGGWPSVIIYLFYHHHNHRQYYT